MPEAQPMPRAARLNLKHSGLLALALAVTVQPSPASAEETKDNAPPANFGPLNELIDHARFDPKRDAYFTKLQDGREVELTLDHALQTQLERVLVADGVSTGAVVLTDPRNGRVLAMVGREESTTANTFAMKVVAPAASIFKLITGAALIESGVDPDSEVCFHGGKHRIEERNLNDDPRRDNRCASFSEAMGRSLNLVFSKLAAKALSSDTLRAMAGRFFFNQPLPVYPAPTSVAEALVSQAEIPETSARLDFGRTAAGFGNVHLSALHGALLAGTVANNGSAAEPRLVDAVWTNGRREEAGATRQERVIAESTAAKLEAMMERTVQEGTARKSFHHGRHLELGDIQVAGKTGTLAEKAPFRDNSWFVGFAPTSVPQIAVSALVINGPRWRIRATALARDALKTYFQVEDSRRRHAAR